MSSSSAESFAESAMDSASAIARFSFPTVYCCHVRVSSSRSVCTGVCNSLGHVGVARGCPKVGVLGVPRGGGSSS